MQAQKAAEAAWNSNPPRNNAELDRLLTGAVIRITVHEGLNLIQAANEADLGEGASVSKRGHNRKTGDLQGAWVMNLCTHKFVSQKVERIHKRLGV